MAKTPSDTLKDLSTQLSKTDPKKFDFLLTEIPDRIRIRTRLGNGLKGKLRALKPSYIKFRERFSELSTETRTNKSNLTLTGEMLYSIIGIRRGDLFTFLFANDFADKKAGWAKESGREFFGLLPTEEKGLRTKIAGIIRQSIRDIFKG
jgi:hypothetical protein